MPRAGRWLASVAVAMLPILASPRPARATAPIVEHGRAPHVVAASDSGVEQLAREASGLGFSTTSTGALAGLGLLLGGLGTGTGPASWRWCRR